MSADTSLAPFPELLLTLTIIAVTVFLVRAVRAWRRKLRALAIGYALEGSLIAAVLMGIGGTMVASFEAANDDGHILGVVHRAYQTIDETLEDDPNASWPSQWIGDEPEPTIHGEPLIYLPVPDFKKVREEKPSTWVAYSPRIRRAFWYAPWYSTDERIVLHADGTIQMLSEEEFRTRRRAVEQPREHSQPSTERPALGPETQRSAQ